MALAARLRLPAIYPYGFFAREGGPLSGSSVQGYLADLARLSKGVA
jgi:hypothetical protein